MRQIKGAALTYLCAGVNSVCSFAELACAA